MPYPITRLFKSADVTVLLKLFYTRDINEDNLQLKTQVRQF